MIDVFRRGWDIHAGNGAMMYDTPYEDVLFGHEYKKKIAGMTADELESIAEEQSPGILTRCHSNLFQYLKDCAGYRADVKSIGFGQPNSQAEIKPTQNGEPYGQLVYGNPVLPDVPGSVSTWGAFAPQCWDAAA